MKIGAIDKRASLLIIVLSIMIGILVLFGDHTRANVRSFSWENKQVGAEDTAFTITFNRPMSKKTVEDNLRVIAELETPTLLKGKFSWSGRKMAYTLNYPAPYGKDYKVELKGAKDKYTVAKGKNTTIKPFQGKFSTRDRIFAYIGITDEEKGLLILYNLTKQQKVILTPPNLLVMEFEIYNDGSKILFGASEYGNKKQISLEQQLYTVTTGINWDVENKNTESGVKELILDNAEYQNLKFDLSPDGKKIVIQRANRKKAGDVSFWVIDEEQKLTKLETKEGGEFVITPDSDAIAITQGEGISLLPLTAKSDTTKNDEIKPLDFLSQYQQVLSFTKNGVKAAMVKFNTDYTKSLFLVTNDGEPIEIFNNKGSILNCQFNPPGTILFCLMTDLIEGPEFKEEPYLAAIDLTQKQVFRFLNFSPEQRNIKMNVSPDGLAILFDQIVASVTPTGKETLTNDQNQDIINSSLWLYPLPFDPNSQVFTPSEENKPLNLPLSGLRPRWFP